ncbi:MAG: GntR family transcriptional regulator [Pseudomonadota bacterium]
MTTERANSWMTVQQEIRRRIQARDWKPGDFIPHEADLAAEFGCARSTMNRALRGLADTGILERKRRAGTRVALNPVRQVRLEIPIIREEIEGKGGAFDYLPLRRNIAAPPPDMRARLQTRDGDAHLHLETLYMSNGAPYVFEDRWINLAAVPQARDERFDTLNPNEWLVREVPFDGGGFAFSATVATPDLAQTLGCAQGDALFVLDRTTRAQDQVITSVRLVFHKGYRLHTEL